ncbi:hypothetical protein [Yoonia sp.]|uniref:hypothetical protein n=1 Tax=Yoonia sp. TaxID=2212373 RepID=UPI001A074972|nr:hypothetical protein [Yoonia sp.]MBE0414543.1 hypothetical protein [Yoonia sp.]
MKRAFSFAVWFSVSAMAAAPAVAACVVNGTTETLYFTIESRDGSLARTGATLPPGAELCLPAAPSAVFTAFASESSMEGCPRMSGPDRRDRLVHFLATDACRWASHGK